MKGTAAASTTRADRRLERARDHVGDLWFPVNEGLLQNIQKGLALGTYQTASLLVHDIKIDFSLFTYCLRELSQMLRENEELDQIPQDINPVTLLEWAGIDRLQQILSVSPAEISAHSLKGISPERLSRFQETMVSATTCEALSANYLLDSDLAYSASLMRQLGLTLIAWNYESVYTAAVAGLTPGITLDVAITQRLGFSPSMLALKVVQNWVLPPEFGHLMVDPSSDQEPSNADEDLENIAVEAEIAELAAASHTLLKICEVGEALARANSSIAYPTAREDWEVAKNELTKVLGTQAVRYLQETLVENCERYLENAPHVFRAAMILDPESRITSREEDTHALSNPYLAKCRPYLRGRLEDIYLQRKAGATRKLNLVTLAREIAPAAGFHRGCVYTIEPSTLLLIPQLVIGTARIEEFPPVPYWANRVPESSVEQAFHSAGPHVHTITNGGVEVAVVISAALGGSQRIGVVCMEINAAQYKVEREQHLLHFKAIVQTFNDSLTLH